MKLIAELNNEKHEVEFNLDGEKIFAKIDGREYELESSDVEPNVFLFKNDNQIHQIYAAPNGIVNVGNNQFDVKIFDPKKLRGSKGSEANADGIAEIKTAMPGKIVRIMVEEGTEVTHGQGVIVVEAMKMQNEMKSPKDGIVKTIKVEEGATVNAGDILVIIE
ncbi:MAG: biotin/lipoyl-binding protein [Pyrinomonadaceae bacterium]|nr:biotin/lipoyl-binding protein [Pyrinomonadaceae bacterium]